MAGPPRSTATWIRRPPGPVLAVAALAAALVLMWGTSVPTGDFDITMYAVLAGAAVCAGWLLRTLCSVITTRRVSWWVPVVPVIVVGCLTVTSLDLPLRLRFGLAQDDFDRVVAAVSQEVDFDHPRGGHVGSYRVDSIEGHGHNVYFFIHGSGFLSSGGFAHLPSGPPATADPIGESVTTTPLAGPWHVFSTSW